MLLTEEQAQEKWCPMVRYTPDEKMDGANRWYYEGEDKTNPVPCPAASPRAA